MDLNELQRRRDAWVEKNFGHNYKPIHSVLGAIEEMGELCHHILKREQGIRGSKEFHSEEIKDAVGDIIIFLAGVATHEGFYYGDVVAEVWEKVESRDWTKNKQDGS